MFSLQGAWPSAAWVWRGSWAQSSQSRETVLSTPDKTDAEVRSEPGEEPARPGIDNLRVLWILGGGILQEGKYLHEQTSRLGKGAKGAGGGNKAYDKDL